MKKKMLSVVLSVVMVAGTFSSFTREVRAEDTVELQFLHTAWVPEQLEVLEKAISDF